MKISDNPYYLVLGKDIFERVANDAESISTYICTNGIKKDLHIYTPYKQKVLKTCGIWIDWCCNSDFREELLITLIPMQKKFMQKLGFPEIP